MNTLKSICGKTLLAAALFPFLLAGLPGCQPKSPPAANEAGAAPPANSYANPAEDQGYAKTVMLQSPEFTESELLKIYQDIEPVSQGSMGEVVEYLYTEKDWPRERAYYILTKVGSSESILTDGDLAREMIRESYPEDLPTERELALVAKHRAILRQLIGYPE